MLIQSPASMPVAQFNTSESTLVSLGDVAWDHQRSYSADAMDVSAWNYYGVPPSPPTSVSSDTEDSPQLGSKVIKTRFTPESQLNDQQSCLPMNQVFDHDGMEAPSSSSCSVSPPPSIPQQLAFSDNGPPRKTFSAIVGMKKGRGGGERITTKDFVPPDVTGLSKREARLLKNRAAAFLSRQRKREEFEAMEIRVRELEEENSRLQTLAERGKKYDSLLSNLEQLQLRSLAAEKRERELTVDLANRTAANLAVKTEPLDLNIFPMSHSTFAAMGHASVMTVMKESLLSSLPSLLSLPSQTPLPIIFSVPLKGRLSSTSFDHQSAPSDIRDQCQGRFGYEGPGLDSSPSDVESSRKMGIGGGLPEAGHLDIDSQHSIGRFSISLDASSAEDGRGSVHVHVSEWSQRTANGAIHGSKQRASPSWSGGDGSMATTCYLPPPLSAPISIPSPTSIDRPGIFAGASTTHPRMGFEAQLMSLGHAPFAQHEPDQAFDYYPGFE